MTFTKEWLLKTIAELEEERDAIPGAVNEDAAMALAAMKLALTSLEEEPVGEVVLGEYDDCGCHPDARVACIAGDGQADWENFKDGTRLYTAPPAPVVPDEMPDSVYDILCQACGDKAWMYGDTLWDACRAAMLQAKTESVREKVLRAQMESIITDLNLPDDASLVDITNEICRLQGDEPVSDVEALSALIEGMEVSVDVSTCDADVGRRYFGTVTEISELDGAKNGYILLVQDAEPNFVPDGKSPAIPDSYDIESFGIFRASEGSSGFIVEIEQFRFGTEKCPQIGKTHMVPKFALQAIINALQQHCDSMEVAPSLVEEVHGEVK